MSSQDVEMSNVENAAPEEKKRKLIKVWSEEKQKYNYKYPDREYYRKYFHDHKKDMKCVHCGKIVTCQMYSHLKSQKCTAIRLAAELEKTKEDIHKLFVAAYSK